MGDRWTCKLPILHKSNHASTLHTTTTLEIQVNTQRPIGSGGVGVRAGAPAASRIASAFHVSLCKVHGTVVRPLPAPRRGGPARNKYFRHARSAGVLPSPGRHLGRPATRWYRGGSDLSKATDGWTGRRSTQWLPGQPQPLQGAPTLPSQRRRVCASGRALAAGPWVHLRFVPNPLIRASSDPWR